MARNSDMVLGATVFPELAPRYRRELVAGAALERCRMLALSSGKLVHATANSEAVVGALPPDSIGVKANQPAEVAFGPVTLVADQALTAGQRLKSGAAGKAIQAVTSALAGSKILAATAGGNFGNQPADDAVEILSNSAADTQSVTVWYTRDSEGDTVFVETLALTGTTEVELTHTDVALVLGVELSAAATGTITVREKSGSATITTISAAASKAGIAEVDAADQRAFNSQPTAVAAGASTKQVGLIGTGPDGAALLDSKALDGTSAVTFASTFRTVTRVLVGDVASSSTAKVDVGAADAADRRVGQALEDAAEGALFNAFLSL